MKVVELIGELAREQPALVRLAEASSLAVLVGSALVRRLRLELVPEADAGTEADLWRSELIRARGPDGFAFLPDCAERLRFQLAQDPRRLANCREITEVLHRHLSPALRLEEEILWLSVSTESDSIRRAEELLASALKALVDEERHGVARWAARAVRELPGAVRSTATARVLEAAALRSLSGGAQSLRTAKGLPGRAAWEGRVPIYVRLFPGAVELNTVSPERGNRINLPATDPLLVDLFWIDPETGEEARRQVTLQRGEVKRIPIPIEDIHLRSVLGDLYHLREDWKLPDSEVRRIAKDTPEVRSATRPFALELRLTLHSAAKDRHRVEIVLEGDGARRTAESTFAFSFSSQDEENLRWYLEDFLQYPEEPAPRIAARIEERLAAMGRELFEAVFKSRDARALWNKMSDRLSETRVEIVTGVAEANTLPWELLRDPVTEAPLALSARAFVRAQPEATRKVRLPARKRSRVRILLVICRPRGARGEADAPFRSVASRLIKGLDQATREAFDLDVLRPPTFEQLGKVLRQAKAEDRPYHVVHFDGHGTFAEIEDSQELWALPDGLSRVSLAGPREGPHGYLLFENPQFADNAQLIDGPVLSKLLAENDVPVLVLNSCKSAHAEPEKAPGAEADPHSQVRAFGSLAQEVMDAGTAGVVAMRYNVYVVTAAQFAAELYASLARGLTLGEAVTQARKNLGENPLREIAFEPRALQDWPVPVVYEAAPLQLFPRAEGDRGVPGGLKIQVNAGASAVGAEEGSLDPSLPAPPDTGFYGRDETLLALDRAFDRDSIVLLHAYAGSGKTSTVAEFARWYSLTGGVEGPVLFTSFERYLPLARVLDRLGQVFGPALERSGIHWLALDDATRRQVALQVLAQVPVLWIWDNVEPVAGFPSGMPSAWSPAEQEELASFLRAARETKAKFLLTSRRDERPWLGDLPTRVRVPPMPTTEALQLARALAEKQNRRLSAVEDWRPLLDFAQGNPMTLAVLVGQVLRENWTSREAIAGYVARLRTGEAAFPDEAGEGRARSLAASFAYGFENAFSEEERRRLALLHLFQGFVDVNALRAMGLPEAPWCLPEVKGLTREEGIALLDRAAEVGLLTAHDDGHYSIHPALPWFFQGLYRQRYPEGDPTARRAFVEAMGELGDSYYDQYEDGNRGVLAVLRAEEANLLHARRLARAHGWWDRVISAMQGLRTLYEPTGRRAEWKRLVDEIVPDFVDPEIGGPLPGREEDWSQVTAYRVQLAREERQWAEAERLQIPRLSWDRQRAAPALARPAGDLSREELHAIRTLVASLHELGETRRELGSTDCVPAYEESLELAERIGYRPGAAACAFSLGRVFETLPVLRDLDAAERWYRKSLDLQSETDGVGRGRCLGQLGSVAYERFEDARATGEPNTEILRHLNEAAGLYREALALLPQDAVDDLAAIHNQLGEIYRNTGDLDRALPHFQRSIHFREQAGNLYSAAQTRYNMALAHLDADRRADALEYAEAALRGFEPYGEGAAGDIEDTRRLIARIRGA